MRKVTTQDSIAERLDQDVRKGDEVEFETSSWSPSSPYLVFQDRPMDLHVKNDGWDMQSVLLLSKRGTHYALLWDHNTYKESEAWLGYVEEAPAGFEVTSRSKLTGLKVIKDELDISDYLSGRMVDLWPNV